jgi:hypothetical protein
LNQSEQQVVLDAPSNVGLQASQSTTRTLFIRVAHPAESDTDGDTYQFTLSEPGIHRIGSPGKITTPITATKVQALQIYYMQLLGMTHQLRHRGFDPPPLEHDKLHGLGRQVAHLLPEQVRAEMTSAIRRVRRAGGTLRVVLEFTPNARKLLGVPWELLLLPVGRDRYSKEEGEFFVFLSGDISLVRQISGVGRHREVALHLPLTIEAVAASPHDVQEIRLDETREAFDKLHQEGKIAASWYAGADTLRVLRERLAIRQPQVVHLIAHGDRQNTGRQFRFDLIVNYADGFSRRVSAYDLTPILSLSSDLQLVVLQACLVGATSTDETQQEPTVTEGIALTLIRHGVPAVVAMQGTVSQEAAAAFAQGFYHQLAGGAGLDRAVATGRVAMHSTGHLVDWSLPVIYQGSGQPDNPTFYTRLTDRIEGSLLAPSSTRTIRGAMIAVALLLLLHAMVRWLLFPVEPRMINLELLSQVFAVWCAACIVGPFVIAIASLSAQRRLEHEALTTRRAIRLARWIGAYIGFSLGGLGGLAILALLWTVLPAILLPGNLLLVGFSGVIIWALLFSDTIARSQENSAEVLIELAPETFSTSTTLVVAGGMLAATLIAPGFVLFGVQAFPNLIRPEVASLVIALMLFAFTIGASSADPA